MTTDILRSYYVLGRLLLSSTCRWDGSMP